MNTCEYYSNILNQILTYYLEDCKDPKSEATSFCFNYYKEHCVHKKYYSSQDIL